MNTYGHNNSNPKIDLFYNGGYQGSTTWSKNNKEAIKKYIEAHNVPRENQHLIKAKRS